MSPNQTFSIETANPSDWPEAFGLAFQHLNSPIREQRVLNALACIGSGAIDPGGIFVARTGNKLAGALVAIPLRGDSGLISPPQVSRPNQEIEDDLLRTSLNWLTARGAKLVQALLLPEEVHLGSPLLRHGFRHVTRLHYLHHDLETIRCPPAQLRWQTYDRAGPELFHRIILSTYENTLDVPELSGTRTIEEIVAGHMDQGVFAPHRWELALEGDQPVGVVMLTVIRDSPDWDLSYMGLTPEARGRGLAAELVHRALGSASDGGARRLSLAVDARNRAAFQLYRNHHFHGVDIREVFLKFNTVHLPEIGPTPVPLPYT